MSSNIFGFLPNNISNRQLSIFLALASVLALAAAYTAEYGFGLKPCILCLYQRIPFAVVVLLGLIGYFTSARYRRVMLGLCGISFLIGAGIAFFHSGVELHWWRGTDACTTTLDTSSVEAIRAQIMGAQAARCDEIPWSLFGLSMANYNVLMSLVLAGIAFTGLKRAKKDS